MKILMPLLFFAAVAATLCGCTASGFDRGAIQQAWNSQEIVYDDAAIRDALAKKPQIRFPIRVAVHLDTLRYGNEWRWTMEDRRMLESYAQTLKDLGIVSDFFVMSDMISKSDDPKALRLAAAKHGADAVLLIKGLADVDSYVDVSGWLNLLIIPGWIVPSSHRDVLFMMKGAMWDVSNEYLYLSVDAETEARRRGPTFRIDTEAVINEAKTNALPLFAEEFVRRMKSLKGVE